MKKVFLPIVLFGLIGFSQAQEVQEEIVEMGSKPAYAAASYDKWSVELNVGGENAIYNWNSGYADAKFLGAWHGDIGIRYMFNPKFGLKVDAGYDRIKNRDKSKEFKSDHWRVDLEGIFNLGRILSFEDWTRSFSVLLHAGGGYAVLKSDLMDGKDGMFNLMAGLTGQYKLSDRFALTADITGMNNLGMQHTWNGLSRDQKYINVTVHMPDQVVHHEGESITIPGQTVTTQVKNPANDYLKYLNPLLNVSLGLTYYLGNKQHADWYLPDSDLRERVDNIEEMLMDSDNDGVADYLDLEPNSAEGAVVDTKGRTIDANGNGVPDVIEQYIAEHYPNVTGGTSTVLTDSNILKQLIDSGIINVYFDYDKSQPFDASVGGIDFVVEYLKMNPNASIDIMGYADPVGGASYNQALSQRRADAVKQIIIGKGIDGSRLNAKGQGIDGDFKGSAISAHQLARRVIFQIK